MKTPGKISLVFILMGVVLGLPPQARAEAPLPPAPEYQATNGEFDVFGQAVVALLKSHQANEFATNYSATAADWQSVVTTNTSKDVAERITNFAKRTDASRQQLKLAAQALLAQAEALHLDFSAENPSCQVVAPKNIGKVLLSGMSDQADTLPYVNELQICLTRDANHQDAGLFKVTLRGLERFPTGWRMDGGRSCIQWTAFPTNVADAGTLRKLAMEEKMAAFKPINSEDDPSLLKLGEALVRFIRLGDTNSFRHDLLPAGDVIWAMYKNSGTHGPTRQELDEELEKQAQEQIAVAGKLVELMKTAGIDLKAADIQIKDAGMEHCQAQGNSTDSLMGQQFRLTLSVKSGAKAGNGTPLSGEYVLGVSQIMKLGGGWLVGRDVRWEKLPAGVVDAATAANLKFETHVAQYGTLPEGTPAPEIECTTLAGEKKMKLSGLRGKVVVLDFWATWCGPCQRPMAELQTVRLGHPAWQDQVVIMPVSIDDTLDIVRRHVDQHGWTNTFNVWAGEGGWRSTVAKTFRITHVPTSYVIDPQGRIVWAGFPDEDALPRRVDAQLER